ncbi:Chemoreceptor glutamine deamidase CheD [Symmachiella macrocystis]|uniref:Probable chemoreceptor glutamine deamidase CheD n=1 Tax=Symmachiella macrocystis TaxID=2527985 RepID=A0A5C6AW26_9PLAN|nr:chemotaxis protein CheD [Symmachiella macrocystis]TWU04143.1 Chemoreceptor glutamine deamidase CheD [Symmachiella macrocystis]
MNESRIERIPQTRRRHVAGRATSGEAPEVVTVRMSEIAVVTKGETIRTLLGSCVGVALYDPHKKIGGLAHVVLPDSRGQEGLPGKFVDTAIPELIRLICLNNGRLKSLTAKLAGGARMFATSADVAIGEQNLAAIERELESRNIPILGRHCGGQQGRRMMFTPSTSRVQIEIVGCDAVEI